MKKQEKGIFNKVFVISVSILLTVYALTMIFLLGWGLLTSLKSRTDFLFAENVLGFPNLEYSRDELLHFANYKLIFENFNFTKKVVFYSGNKLITHESESNFFTLILITFYNNIQITPPLPSFTILPSVFLIFF